MSKSETLKKGKDTEEIARETLTGDLRDLVLNILKSNKDLKPWNKMKESEQKTLAAQVQNQVESAVRRAVTLIATDDRPMVHGKLEQVLFKDGMKCVITMPKGSEERHAIADAQGTTIVMVVPNTGKYIGEKAPVKTDKDQPDLPVADNAKNIPQNKDTANGEDHGKDVPSKTEKAA